MHTKPPQEEEKTTFEKFEDEVKGTLFSVLYVLLKDDQTTFTTLLIMQLIDFF